MQRGRAGRGDRIVHAEDLERRGQRRRGGRAHRLGHGKRPDAARTLVANELIAWGRAGLEAHEDLDPARLLAEAIAIDPLAPDTYWYLGERFLVAGSPGAAFTLFELGAALPGREMTPILQQSVELKSRIEDVAPAYFPAAFGLNSD